MKNEAVKIVVYVPESN